MKKNIRIIILSFFIITFFGLLKQVYADACEPNTCLGSQTYTKINGCEFKTSECGFTSVTPSVNITCGAATCTGFAAGGGDCPSARNVSTSCDCSEPASSGDCSGPGQSCGLYGTCSNCTTTGTCYNPTDRALSCCGNNPPPPPTEWCGDGICQGSNNETCSSCETDCGVCSPPPGPYCGDGSCNNGESNCDCAADCSGTCPANPSCDVSLSPSTVSLYTDDSPFNITANISNIQNGNVDDVEFYVENGSTIANISPRFDSSLQYESKVTPISTGNATIRVNVFMGSNVRCSTTASLTVSAPPPPVDEGPDCDAFDVTSASVTQGDPANWEVTITDEGRNVLTDGGFESGGMSNWPTAYQLNAWWTPATGGTQAEGAYFAAIARDPATHTDPHGATDWEQTGENLSGKEYTFKFLAKSHEANKTIPNILIQREPNGGDWSGTGGYIGNITLNPSTWTEFSTNITFANIGSTTTRLRAVLRPPQDDWPVYYDSVTVFKTSDAGVSDSTVKFYYRPASTTGCGGWIDANDSGGSNVGTRIGSTNYFEFVWDTSTVTPGDYTIAVNAVDILGNGSTGNPGGECGSGLTPRPACNATQTIVACSITCSEDCGGGITLDETPAQVTGVQVNSLASGNVDLTSSANLNISWTAATISSPATVNYYVLKVWDRAQGTTPPGTCDATTDCVRYQTATALTSYAASADSDHGNNVYVAVRAVNDDCTTTRYGSWSSSGSFDLVAQVSGSIIDSATAPDGSNNCVGGGSAIDISAGIPTMVSTTGGNLTTSPGAAGNYIMSNVPYAPSSSWNPDHNFSLTLNLANPDPANSYYCSCPGGSPFSCAQTNTTSPATSQNYFVTAVDLSNGPWWQISEGNVYGNSGYQNSVPDACAADVTVPLCDANIVTQNVDGDSKSAGLPMSGGSINANGYYTAYDGSDQPRSENTTHDNLIIENYNYFTRSIDLSSVQIINGAIITAIPDNGTVYDDAEVFHRTGNLTIDLSALETITSVTKKVIFVSGNITFDNTNTLTQLIDVENGGFIAFIAGGDITFSNDIGNTCAYPTCSSTDTNIDGVFVASDNLIVADDGDDDAPDNIFVGEGTFVGWNGINLNRSFDNNGDAFDRAINNQYPTELFTFRPDFNENTPDILRHPNLVWQEVN